MNNHLKALFGAWDQAIGTLLSAISNTPSTKINETMQTHLDILGNVMQATGNALLADSEKKRTLNKLGNQIQSLGNATVVAGLLIQFNKSTKIKLSVKGNLLQAIGSGISLPDLLKTKRISVSTLYDIYGTLLQVVGNSLQALSGMIELSRNESKGNKAEDINFVGSWVQAIGALVQALVQQQSARTIERTTE